MAIRKTGSRVIVVDGVSYRWRVRRKLTYSQGTDGGMGVAIERADCRGAVLVARCGHRPDNWLQRRSQVLTPEAVAAIIRSACAAGWNPTVPGPQFVFLLGSPDQPGAR